MTIKEIKDDKKDKIKKSIKLAPTPSSNKGKILKSNVKIFETTAGNRKPVMNPTNQIQNHVTTTQMGNSVIKQESIEYTLPAVRVDSTHRIDSYYPYFYKTHVIDYYDKINVNDSTNNCLDVGCEWCNLVNTQVCRKCRHGWFLFNSQCYTTCPLNYVADIFRRTCHPLDINSKKIKII